MDWNETLLRADQYARAHAAAEGEEWEPLPDEARARAVDWLTNHASQFPTPPCVNVSPFGDVALEWAHSEGRVLTVFIRGNYEALGEAPIEYLAAWGPHMIDEMADGPVIDDLYLFHWLTEGGPFDAGMAAGEGL